MSRELGQFGADRAWLRKLRANEQGRGQLELGAIPSVLLAESWQNLHDMAAKGNGFDVESQKRVNG